MINTFIKPAYISCYKQKTLLEFGQTTDPLVFTIVSNCSQYLKFQHHLLGYQGNGERNVESFKYSYAPNNLDILYKSTPACANRVANVW